MYEDLVKRLRTCGNLLSCNKCKWEPECDGISDSFRKAADAIESTNKAYQMISEAYEAEVTKQNWISVTEKLPDQGKFVLVYGDLYPNKHDGGVIAVSKRMDWNYWQGFGRERNITHWMPLPEPPKEK